MMRCMAGQLWGMPARLPSKTLLLVSAGASYQHVSGPVAEPWIVLLHCAAMLHSAPVCPLHLVQGQPACGVAVSRGLVQVKLCLPQQAHGPALAQASSVKVGSQVVHANMRLGCEWVRWP